MQLRWKKYEALCSNVEVHLACIKIGVFAVYATSQSGQLHSLAPDVVLGIGERHCVICTLHRKQWCHGNYGKHGKQSCQHSCHSAWKAIVKVAASVQSYDGDIRAFEPVRISRILMAWLYCFLC